jgi:hypothetical protein
VNGLLLLLLLLSTATRRSELVVREVQDIRRR